MGDIRALLGISAIICKYRRSDADENTFREQLFGLTLGPTQEAVLDCVAERAAKVVRATGVYVERLDSERQELVATALHGEDLPPIGTRGPYRGSVAEQAISSETPITIANLGEVSRSILASVKVPFPAIVLPIRSDHTPIGALIVIRRRPFTQKDIGRLRAFADLSAVSLRRLIMLEQLEQRSCDLQKALQTREELLRVLAHDLRNPVNTIAMANAVLQNNHPSQTALTKLYEMIERSTKRMNRLIQDLLDEAVIEHSGTLPIKPLPHQADSIAEEVCEITRVQAKGRTLDVQCHIGGKATVYADHDRLLQVLTNLIDNALKFTPQGGRITVRSEVREDHVRFSISDTGPGIPEEYRHKIFEPYFQAPETAHLGSGLGLAIAKKIVEQHGGNIWVESAEGEGTTFTFTIPAEPVAA